jgi:hypothetical protein
MWRLRTLELVLENSRGSVVHSVNILRNGKQVKQVIYRLQELKAFRISTKLAQKVNKVKVKSYPITGLGRLKGLQKL